VVTVTVSTVEPGPRVVTLTPANRTLDIATNASLSLTFDSNIQKKIGYLRVFKAVNDQEVAAINVTNISVNGKVAEASLATPLEVSYSYYIKVDQGTFSNLSGLDSDGITSDIAWQFTTKLVSNNADLSSLKVNGISVSNFSAKTAAYTVELPFGTTAIPAAVAIAAEVSANVQITSPASLPGQATFLVTAQDGTTTKTYTINYTLAAPKTDAALSNLKVSETTVVGFAPATLEYTISYPYGTTTIPTVAYTLNDATASASITNALSMPGFTTVIVTAQDGTTKQIYKVNFAWNPASTDATISSSVYTVNSTAETISGVPITETLASLKSNLTPAVYATFQVYQSDGTTIATDLQTGYKVVVTAQDGITIKTYSITLKTEYSHDANFVSFSVTNVYAEINTGTHTITATVPFGTDLTGLQATFLLTSNATSKVGAVEQVSGITANDFSVNVVYSVTAEDATTIVSWTVIISVTAPKTNATLSNINVDGVPLTGFSPATLDYTVTYPFGTTAVPSVSYTVADETASAVKTDAATMPGSTSVVVTAQDGTTKQTYTVNFAVTAPRTDATLSDLKVNGVTVNGFTTSTHEYTINYPYGQLSAPNVTYTLSDAYASVTTTDPTAIPGYSTVDVIAQDGVTKLTYKVNFVWDAPSADATVTSGLYTVNGVDGTITNVPANTTIATFKSNLTPAPYASFEVYNSSRSSIATDLQTGYTVVVTAQDGVTKKTYTVTVITSVVPVESTRVNAYPNPFTEEFTIGGGKVIREIAIFNMLGQKVLEQTDGDTVVTVSASNLRTGVYFLTIKFEEGTSTTLRIVKR